MHQLTQAAFETLDEVWASIAEQELSSPEPVYLQQLWRMAGNICTGFALQHRTAQELSSANTFEWLASICDTRQLMTMEPQEKSNPAKLAVVQSLPRTH